MRKFKPIVPCPPEHVLQHCQNNTKPRKQIRQTKQDFADKKFKIYGPTDALRMKVKFGCLKFTLQIDLALIRRSKRSPTPFFHPFFTKTI